MIKLLAHEATKEDSWDIIAEQGIDGYIVIERHGDVDTVLGLLPEEFVDVRHWRRHLKKVEYGTQN